MMMLFQLGVFLLCLIFYFSLHYIILHLAVGDVIIIKDHVGYSVNHQIILLMQYLIQLLVC